MDPKDQVAIHEAMEQQTISITKAGVKVKFDDLGHFLRHLGIVTNIMYCSKMCDEG